MSFITENINYGNIEIPSYKLDYDLTANYFTINKTINGVSYSVKYTVDSIIGNNYLSTKKLNNDIYAYMPFILKSKNAEKYVAFYMNVKWADTSTLQSDSGVGVFTGYLPTFNLLTSLFTVTRNHSLTKNNVGLFFLETPKYYYLVYQEQDTYQFGQLKPFWYLTGISKDFINRYLGEIETRTYSPEYGTPSGSGGYSGGSFDNSSDTIAIPTKPSIGVTNVGFVNVYNPSTSGLVNLGSELFPDFTPPQPAPLSADITEALQLGFNNVVENITNFTNMFINSKLIDYVIDCHVIPIKPTVTESESIKIGFKSFNQTASKVTSDYIDFDCGSLNIKEYYTNFIDYVGTRAKLYLPFVGFVPIENEYFQNGILNVKYRFNVIDGSFMCYVLATSSKSQLKNSVIASYGGNACVHIPITGLNYSNMITGLTSGTVATIATASIGGGLASKALSSSLASADAAVGTLNSALNTLANKPSMQSSNGYNSTSAYLGIRYPYLVIEREVSNFSEYYTSENGLPCNITKTINELSGYVEMDNIHMETLTCTDEEKTMIENLLKSGVIV